jgi:hypothetical protein
MSSKHPCLVIRTKGTLVWFSAPTAFIGSLCGQFCSLLDRYGSYGSLCNPYGSYTWSLWFFMWSLLFLMWSLVLYGITILPYAITCVPYGITMVPSVVTMVPTVITIVPSLLLCHHWLTTFTQTFQKGLSHTMIALISDSNQTCVWCIV